MRLCKDHEAALGLALTLKGYSKSHPMRMRAEADARLLVFAQVGELEPTIATECAEGKTEGARENCLVCRMVEKHGRSAKDFPRLAAEDAVEFYKQSRHKKANAHARR